MSIFNDDKIIELEGRMAYLENEINKYNTKCRENDCAHSKSEFEQPGERKNCWFNRVLHKTWSLVNLGTGDDDDRNRNKSCNICPDSKT